MERKWNRKVSRSQLGPSNSLRSRHLEERVLVLNERNEDVQQGCRGPCFSADFSTCRGLGFGACHDACDIRNGARWHAEYAARCDAHHPTRAAVIASDAFRFSPPASACDSRVRRTCAALLPAQSASIRPDVRTSRKRPSTRIEFRPIDRGAERSRAEVSSRIHRRECTCRN